MKTELKIAFALSIAGAGAMAVGVALFGVNAGEITKSTTQFPHPAETARQAEIAKKSVRAGMGITRQQARAIVQADDNRENYIQQISLCIAGAALIIGGITMTAKSVNKMSITG